MWRSIRSSLGPRMRKPNFVRCRARPEIAGIIGILSDIRNFVAHRLRASDRGRLAAVAPLL